MSAVSGAVRCEACDVESYPAQSLNERMKLVPTCPACGFEHKFSVNEMMDTPVALAMDEPKFTVLNEPKYAKVTPIRNSQIENAPPTDVIGMIQSRLQFLDVELAKAAGYATERKKLARMLAAAEKIQ